MFNIRFSQWCSRRERQQKGRITKNEGHVGDVTLNGSHTTSINIPYTQFLFSRQEDKKLASNITILRANNSHHGKVQDNHKALKDLMNFGTGAMNTDHVRAGVFLAV